MAKLISLASIILLNIGHLMHFSDSAEIVSHSVELPCKDRAAIQWVRSRSSCTQYFICHFGHPLAMPPCPFSQVWSNKARNCVPENSRWNDCNETDAHAGTEVVDNGKGRKNVYTVSVTSPRSVLISFQPLTTLPAPVTRPRTTTTFVTVNGSTHLEESDDADVRIEWQSKQQEQEDAIHLESPTVKSPFRPVPKQRYYTYQIENDGTGNKTGSTSKTPLPLPQTTLTTKSTVTTAATITSSVTTLSSPTTRSSSPTTTFTTPTTRSSSPTTTFTTPTTTLTTPTTTFTTPTTKLSSPTTTLATTMSTYPFETSTTTTAKTPETDGPFEKDQTMRGFHVQWQPRVTPTTRTPLPSATEILPRTSTDRVSGWEVRPMQLRLPDDHPCRSRPGRLVAHSSLCHWYYNCTLVALENMGGNLATLEGECRYPQLFDVNTERCREFINVRCGERFEPVDPCEYQALQCRGANCVPCQHRYGSCRGLENGIYPFHTHRWTPTFITCYQQRNIAQDDCQAPTPIFSPEVQDCVSLYDVPKEKGGLRPDCSFREDGLYPDEQGRCGIFFECQDGLFAGYDECPSGTVFDPMTLRCQLLDRASPPCGEGPNPSCSERQDGLHADPFGRCPYYFECRQNQFVRHLTCDYGSFDPTTQECVIPTELMPRPCGLLPNPCEDKTSGFYPDMSNSCRHYMECSRGVIVSNGVCPNGTVFSSISGRCDRLENAPAPCGVAPSCENRADGRYSALTRGCSFYYECQGQTFAGLKQCTFQDGGFFFNEQTGQCDFPQNICPPCGYRWWGCSNSSFR